MTNFVEAINFSFFSTYDFQDKVLAKEIIEIFNSISLSVRPIKYGQYKLEKKINNSDPSDIVDFLTNNTEEKKNMRMGGIILGINSDCGYSIHWDKSDNPNFSSISGFLALSKIKNEGPSVVDDFLEIIRSLIKKLDPVYADVKSMMIKNWDAPIDLRVRLPDIPPISVYGKEYIQLFGERKILDSPFKKIEKIGNCFWLETGELVTEEVPSEKRKEIREYFGENSFMANGKWKYKEGIAPLFSLKTDYKGAMGYVTQADSDLISIKVFGIPTAQKLMMDGFKLSDNNEMILNVSSELEKAQLFDKLRSYDLAFAGGREWSPAEVFEYLVDKGLLSSGYKKITWTNPNTYKITDVV